MLGVKAFTNAFSLSHILFFPHEVFTKKMSINAGFYMEKKQKYKRNAYQIAIRIIHKVGIYMKMKSQKRTNFQCLMHLF